MSTTEMTYTFFPDQEAEQEVQDKRKAVQDAEVKMNAAIKAAHQALDTPSWQFSGGTYDRARVIDEAIALIFDYDQKRSSLSGSIVTGLKRKEGHAP